MHRSLNRSLRRVDAIALTPRIRSPFDRRLSRIPNIDFVNHVAIVSLLQLRAGAFVAEKRWREDMMQTARVESPKAVRRAFRGPSLIREVS